MVYFMIEVTEQAAFQIKDMLKDAEDGERSTCALLYTAADVVVFLTA